MVAGYPWIFPHERRHRRVFAVCRRIKPSCWLSTRALVSRFFVPKAGIAEDPVTGSAHCTLVPFWAANCTASTVVIA